MHKVNYKQQKKGENLFRKVEQVHILQKKIELL